MTWVKFHSELREGAKRGLPRATRFVFLELSLLTRSGRGETALPIGMSDVDAVHDMLGGSRREVADALKALTAGPEPMVEFRDGPAGRWLRIPSWNTWNRLDLSTERVAEFRAKHRGNADETRYIGVGNGDVTAPDQIREEEIREDQISERASARDPDDVGDCDPGPEAAPAKPKRGTKADRERRGSRCPTNASTTAVFAWLTEHGIPPDDPDVPKFLDWHRSHGTKSLDWPASWRTWKRNAAEFAARRNGNGRASMRQPKAAAAPAFTPQDGSQGLALLEGDPTPEPDPWDLAGDRP